MQLDGRSVGCLAHPNVQILGLASLEEEDVVAVVEIGQFVELVELRLGVEFCIFATVREKRVEVVEEMAVSVYSQ